MQETEQVREQEQALTATEKTHQLKVLLQFSKGNTRAPADNFWELKMNVRTFLSLLWVLFGADCDYYKSLCQIHKTLELKEVYALKDKFSPENCHRITWAILDDGRAFFDNVKTTIDFTGPEMTFLQSFLIDILNSVWYAVPVERASFPDKWRRRERKEDKGGKTPGMGQGSWNHTGDNTPIKGGYGAGSGGEKQQHPYGYGRVGGGQDGNRCRGQGFLDPFGRRGGGGQGDWRSGWTDVRNHKIKELMDPYLEQYNGQIHLAEVLDVAGKHQTDLPILPRFCHSNGWPFLCWNSTLG
jgi:hypothetical protein